MSTSALPTVHRRSGHEHLEDRSATVTGALDGKVGIVTGAASGLGEATALAAVREGARVVVVDLDEAGGKQTVEAAGGEAYATFFRADIRNVADADAMVDHALQKFGRLDFAHNNAGIDFAGPLTDEISPADWERVISVNLSGCWNCMRAEIPALLRQERSSIVNTSSGLGVVAVPGQAAYIAAKHGVIGLTRAAALDYATRGLRVNAICPGVVETPMLTRFFSTADPATRAYIEQAHPIGRLGRPEEIAAAVVWLLSDASSFTTGLPMIVDGGYTAQ